MKKVFVLWSGGLDSTFLVEKNLADGNDVTVGYVRIGNNVQKSKKELDAINKMCDYFNCHYSGHLYNIGIISEFTINQSNTNLVLCQLPVWINSLLYIDDRYDEIQIGYTMNDDAISYIPDILSIYNSYESIMRRPLAPLTFPLMKQKKADTIFLISDEIRKMVVFCEDEYSDFCGTCHSCKRMIDAIQECKEWYGRDFSGVYPFMDKTIQKEFDFSPSISIVS